ncbi:hypothetical protein LTR49_025115 [Elasticomyces elasticus]|nr:hypothetical protein LTR49_025115 [Elasticomyces elasticus]
MSGRGRGRGGYSKDSDQQSVPFRTRGSSRGGSGPFRGQGGAPSPSITIFEFASHPLSTVEKMLTSVQARSSSCKDKAITQREDDPLNKTGKDSAVTLPRRPAYGSQGQKLLFWSNYFRLQMGDMILFRYAIKIKKGGRDVPRGLAKRLIQLLVEGLLKDMHINAVSDFRSTLIFRTTLNDELNFNVTYQAEGETEAEDDAAQYQVMLEPSGTLNVSELVQHSTSTSAGTLLNQSQELLQALNIIVVGHAS